MSNREVMQVAWRTFDGEGGYDYTTYDDDTADYAEKWSAQNPAHVGWVEPLYLHPASQEKKEKGVCASYAQTPCLQGSPRGEQRERAHQAPDLRDSLPEPVAWMYDHAEYQDGDLRGRCWRPNISRSRPHDPLMVRNLTPLYTAPQRQPLTEEHLRKMHHEDQFGLFCDYDDFEQIARAIEQRHGIGGQDDTR